MRLVTRLVVALSLAVVPALATAGPGSGGSVTAKASVKVSISADVSAAGKAQAAAGDAAYAAGDMEAALATYGQGFAATRDTAFVYAMARAHEASGHKAEAEQMFKMYLGASSKASLEYKGEAQAAIGVKAETATGGALALAGKTVDAAKGAVADVGAGVYGAAKVSVSGSVSAGARAKAKAADSAYAAGKYDEASKAYLEAYAQSQQPVTLYAAAQARAQAGDAIGARALLTGYLTAQPSGAQAKDASTLLLAVGGNPSASARATVKTSVSAGDTAFKAGKYLDAAKAYGEAHAKTGEATLLYARGTAQLYAGNVAAARKDLEAYLAAGGNLEFKAQAQTSLRMTGSATAGS